MSERLPIDLGTALPQAIERGELVLHYQPQMDVETGKAVGVEALVRWQHPARGLLQPAEFIPEAEKSDLIVRLDEWVLKAACAQARAWQDHGLPAIRVGVNISARHFSRPDLLDIVREILQESRLAPQFLNLEITESLLLRNTKETVATLNKLKALGVRVSLNHFGIGYSNLGYLRHTPLNSVKLDRTFVADITDDPEAAALTKAIIALVHGLRLNMVVEGVETEGQVAFLAENRCRVLQGVYFSPPLPADECLPYLLQPHEFSVPAFKQPKERVLLIVDDEANVTSSLKRLLRGDGYRILTADSGKQGLELLAVNRVGVIISDQRMPEMTGVEFLRRVKDLYPETIRIVLSGYTDLQSITDAINEGAIYRFLTKPWEDDQLQDTVREAFQRYELKQENTFLAHEIERANRELSQINRELEQRVAEKTREINQNVNMLRVSQEILEHLPTAVIGVDEDGLIVMANRRANALLNPEDGAGSLLGSEAAVRLPSSLVACLNDENNSVRSVVLDSGCSVQVICHRMGETCISRGKVLVMAPVESSVHLGK